MNARTQALRTPRRRRPRAAALGHTSGAHPIGAVATNGKRRKFVLSESDIVNATSTLQVPAFVMPEAAVPEADARTTSPAPGLPPLDSYHPDVFDQPTRRSPAVKLAADVRLLAYALFAVSFAFFTIVVAVLVAR